MIDKVKFIEELSEAQLFVRMHIMQIREYYISTIPEKSNYRCFLDYQGLNLLEVDDVRYFLKKNKCKISLDKFSKMETDLGIKVEGTYFISYFHKKLDKNINGIFWGYNPDKLKDFT